ncbi:hypothetical protein V493_01402 [Pseudogymnoascus sp. VKM F-4281 (FW-2241)]|nr:hypothetical protein V493_01402 [Pseudogymnoascus sp. VKM F-4281 (FW-2241)]
MVSSNGEIRIDEALHTMNAGGVKNRTDGVTDLITIFKHNRQTSSLEVLKDGAYHTIYEALFKVATEEKRLYVSAKNDKARTKAEKTLSSCSEALRITIKAGAEKLKPRTVRAVIEHVTQLLPVASGEYCLAFSQQYLKVLNILLGHEAHVELLDQDDWLATVEFCLDGIEQYENNTRAASIPHGNFITIPLSTASSVYTSRSRSSVKSVSGEAHLSSIKKRNSEELMECLLSLVSAPNAAVSERTAHILKAIVHFLNSQGNVVSFFHQVAFAALNAVLSVTSADEISLAESVICSVVPCISRLWSSKTAANDEMLNTAKDEMAITIMLLRLHLEKLVFDPVGDDDLGNILEDLRGSLANDYEKRAERDQLQLDDLDFAIGSNENQVSDSLSCGYLRLRQQALRAERKWAVVQVLAILDNLLHGSPLKSNILATDDTESLEGASHPRKRRRVVERFDALIEEIRAGDSTAQLIALQILFFALPPSQVSQHALAGMLSTLASLVLDRNINISCWAMLCISGCAHHQSAAESSTSSFDWKQLWHTVSRLVTSRALCRPACYLLHIILAKKLVEYNDVVEWATSMLTMTEISAPASICDSSLALMAHLIHMRSTEGSGGSVNPGQNVVRWVFSKWNPAEKAFAARSAIDIHPVDVFNLLRAIFDLPGLALCANNNQPGGVISQAWFRHRKNEKTLRFLLLIDDEPKTSTQCSRCAPTSRLYQRAQSSDAQLHGNPLKRLVSDLLLPKLDALAQGWEGWEQQDASEAIEISSDSMHSTVSACITACLILSILENSGSSSMLDDIKRILERLGTIITSVTPQGGINRLVVEAMLQAIQPYLPAISSKEICHIYQTLPRLGKFIVSFAEIFKLHKFQKEDGFANDDMDLDSVFDTQQSWTRSERSQNVTERREMAMKLSPATFFNNTSTKLILAASFFECEAETLYIPTNFMGYLLNLPPMDIVSCTELICEILHSDLSLNSDDASGLVQCVGGLLSPQYSCCEVTLGLCIDTMEGLLPSWAGPVSGELGELVQQLYGWLVSTVVSKRRTSPAVQIRISNLLFQLIRIQPTYGDSQSLPSVRSILFDILQKAPILVKFNLAQKIPDIFGLFVLKNHLRILNDLLDSLPTDLDWCEGNAFRLYILSRLASRWPTLLRICAYYILEVSGRVPVSIPYAKRCLLEVSETLGLSSARELFQLFNSQLLFTWLDTEPFESLPHSIFGYNTLHGLLRDSQEEISALMVMRDRDDEVKRLAELLEKPVEQILTRSFTKVIAYSVAHDISIPPSDTSGKYITGEARVRKLLGKNVFLELVKNHFADIISLLFKLIDHEQDLEKSFMKEDALQIPASILSEIKGFSSSDITLPPSQQPTFKAKYLTREINHVCGRTPYEPSDIFTPVMVTFVARKLLDTMNPALGSLHACSILRRLRVLIGLAGSNAVSGYPLEMLLHNLRPLLADVECADDAIGIAQYLFTRGSEYLTTVPSFMITITLSMFGTLKRFLNSSPSNTTQESQYRETLSKAESFHSWLGLYLKNYKAVGLDRKDQDGFRTMVESAQGLSASGSTDIGTTGGDLLMDILRDKRTGRNLLSKSTCEVVFSLLYSEFAAPTSFRTDHLGHDDRAVRYAPTLWELCKSGSTSSSFLTWAGRVFGRAFAATGHIELSLLKETDLHEILDPVEIDASHKPSSRTSILGLVKNLMVVDHGSVTGVAEAALRIVVSGITSQPDNADGAACSISLSESLIQCSSWSPYNVPPADMLAFKTPAPKDPFSPGRIEDPRCIQDLSIFLVQSVPSDSVIHPIQKLLVDAPGFAEKCFPFILHIVLSQQLDESKITKRLLSTALRSWFDNGKDSVKERLKLLINAILYLRTQALPRETSIADRSQWLDIDYRQASQAAVNCGMLKTALLFTELSSSELVKVSRRSSLVKQPDSKEILFSIFKNLDDPDIFYGLQRTATLETISARMEYEKDGLKTLMFRGAEYDIQMRKGGQASTSEAQSLVGALSMLDLDGLSHSLLQSQQTAVVLNEPALQNMFRTARKLEQWDLPIPDTYDGGSITIYKTFQALNNALDRVSAHVAIDTGIRSAMSNLIQVQGDAASIHTSLQALSIFTEIDEVLSSTNSEQFEEMLQRFESRSKWMKTGKFEDVSQIISSRQTLLSCVNQQTSLRKMINVSASDTRLVEAQASLLSSSIHRSHGALQESLTSATYLNSITGSCRDLGLNIEAAAYFEVANAMWDQGEMASSIGTLQELEQLSNLKEQTIPIAKSKILAKIASQVSMAKLEKPDRIIEKYLSPALAELKGKTDGSDAGQVYHEFAVFCDRQYQDPDSIEDLERLRTLKEMKEMEVETLLKLSKEATSGQKQRNHRAYNQAKQWLALDTEEYERLNDGRGQLLRRSLENYLLSLAAWDDHNNDALRFTALWLEHSDEEVVSESVLKYIDNVATLKFASLANQLTSRLLDTKDKFQVLLLRLVLNICKDHPHHGMYQIWAGTNSNPSANDETALSRQKAAKEVALKLSRSARSGGTWSAIDRISHQYCHFASEREKVKSGSRINLRNSPAGSALNAMLQKNPLPPPTLQIELAADKNYSRLPTMISVDPSFSIASGISAPKIVTLLASNGKRYKQLVKGGADDLRQDAIMEQVFAQVSALLKENSATRQRNLGIRTYKVLPLSSTAGIIEFVPNTIPLHEFLMPAHERFYPKDLRSQQCRSEIQSVQTQKLDLRVKKYLAVTDRFHPVLRYFHLEKFTDPDEWFARRLAYTRSTAAISILGYVLGLGDRHGHNILLDEKTGEVVHIDLGVAFEMGRVLPVPELVPFRLTRDIVDGMGISKTEGVYRRCCEFTLEALRKEADTIMTILDVLRYDPLYTWSISPIRLAKLQDAQSAAPPISTASSTATSNGKSKGAVNEPSEADRALTVVRKKLSKTLSVTATVNDLINQATDERNLAVLFAGWAAYA